MISIIIPFCKNNTYLVRCLNSIRKQTFADYEIIGIGNYYTEEIIEEYKIRNVVTEETDTTVDSSIYEALQLASGTKIFFQNTTSVLAANTLHQLNMQCDAENPVVSGKLLFPQGKVYSERKESLFTPYGKLFLKEFVIQNNIAFSGNDTMHIESMVETIQCIKKVPITLNEAYIYEPFADILPRTIQSTIVNDFLDINKYMEGSEDSYIAFIKEVLKGDMLFEAKKQIICGYAKVKAEDYENNYFFLKEHISKWYNNAVANKDAEAFEAAKEFITLFEKNTDFCNLIFKELKITEEIYDCMKRNTIEKYLFFKDKISGSNMQKTTENQILELQKKITALNEVQNKLKELIDKKQIQPVAKNVAPKNEVIVAKPTVNELTGPILAEYVVDACAKGRLGLKTIIKALIAWLKFKSGAAK